MRPFRILCAWLALSQSLLFSQGAGDLMIGPTRIVLEGQSRSTEVTLVNRGKDKATYRIAFVELEMNEDGVLLDHNKTPGEITASDLIRYSPKQIDLEPNIAQTVRLQLRVPEGLQPGEYRSHMTFKALPRVEAPADLTPQDGPEVDPKSLSVSIIPIYGVSIPVIVRYGETKAEIELESLQYLPSPKPDDPKTLPACLLHLRRKGNRGTYGDVTISYLPASGKEVVLGKSLGVAVYNNLQLRALKVPLKSIKEAPLGRGRLKASYTPQDAKEPTSITYLDLP
jgi:hypothetical protein